MKNEIHSPPTPADLLNDLQTLVRDTESLMSASVSEHSAEAIQALRERFSAVQARFSQIYAGAKRRVTAGAAYADESIRANPYQTMGIAFGAGLLIGLLIRRRQS